MLFRLVVVGCLLLTPAQAVEALLGKPKKTKQPEVKSAKPPLSAQDFKDDVKSDEKKDGKMSKAEYDQKARSNLLLGELRTLVNRQKELKLAKAERDRKNVLKAKKENITFAPQKFRLFHSKDAGWKTTCSIRGLALGGWFVPEKFINIQNFATPDMPASFKADTKPDPTGSIYEGSTAPDMCRLSQEIGREELDARFKKHLNTFITEDDIAFIAKTGVNTLRIPIGYWNVVEDPYKIFAPINPANSLTLMEKAMGWAEKYNLAVILDLHSSPGSQNGWEHSGCAQHGSGLFSGNHAEQNRKLSVEVAETLAKRFGKHPALLGIQVINEPTHYEGGVLMDLYRDSYEAIRKHTDDVWVIVYAHKYEKVRNLARNGETFHNLILDKHEYACFGDGRTGSPGATYMHHRHTAALWQKELTQMNKEYPTILGEWSLCHGGGVNMKLKDWNVLQQTTWLRSTVGSVFWTYKTLTENARWSYRVALDTVDIWGEMPTCDAEPNHKKKQLLAALSSKQHEEALDDDKALDVGYEWEAKIPQSKYDAEEAWTFDGAPLEFRRYDGFIHQNGEIMQKVMTVEEAKAFCPKLPECSGFTFQGAETDGPTTIVFAHGARHSRNKHNLKVEKTWTSYLRNADENDVKIAEV